MYKKLILFFCCFVPTVSCGDDLIDQAQQVFDATQIVCSGISDEISKVSNVSKINTAVTGVGTVAAGGALVAGVKKSQEEEEIDKLVAEICANGGCTAAGVQEMTDEEFFNNVIGPMAEVEELRKKLKRSKKLGNWRTGLMAGTVGANIASAIVSGVNRDQSELVQHIQACNQAIVSAGEMSERLKKAGVSPVYVPVADALGDVGALCGNINTADIEKIEKRMTGVMGTSIAGAVIGVAGTATSAAANSDKYMDDKNRLLLNEQDRKKKDNLNATANVLAGANVATGLVGTGLNVSLVTLAQKLIKQAERCESVFK